eukprot:2550275-Rhodomonas_salina.1
MWSLSLTFQKESHFTSILQIESAQGPWVPGPDVGAPVVMKTFILLARPAEQGTRTTTSTRVLQCCAAL